MYRVAAGDEDGVNQVCSFIVSPWVELMLSYRDYKLSLDDHRHWSKGIESTY